MDKLKKHRQIWTQKQVLRLIYGQWYQMMINQLTPGKTIEIGSGIGSFKQFKKDIITSDYQKKPWLDLSFDAHKMPFKANSIANICLLDVLHHLENPLQFLDEAKRVLKKNGRLIMIEPYPSLFSLIVYRLFHPEPFIFNQDYFKRNSKNSSAKDPWDSNQAIPFQVFFKDRLKFQKRFKQDFKIIHQQKFSFLLYPLSGGFENKPLIPVALFPFFSFLEKIISPLSNLLAFRCFIVLEKV